MTELLHKDLTSLIIGVYYDVYNNTSHTYPEYIYEAAIAYDLQKLGIPYQRQPTYEVIYKDHKVGEQRLDIFPAGEVVVGAQSRARADPPAQSPGYVLSQSHR